MPTSQMITVRQTSQIERARALTYFVTVTLQTLKTVIEMTPRIAKDISRKVVAMVLKYYSDCSMKGSPSSL
jgi:hypothetical protein